MTVTIDDIRAAAETLAGRVVHTPTLVSRTLSEITGAEVAIKFENLQFTGSFKDRGALVKLLSLSQAERRAGVIAMSAGNHAQGVAYHAGQLGIPATIVMPRFTPFVKVRQTRRFGARIELVGQTIDESGAHARAIAEREGLTFVHPYDDEAIIAGQGTAALEMLAERPDLEVLVFPIGGGGLIAGAAIAAHAVKPEIEIYGVEVELYASMTNALKGLPQVAGGQTAADGIAVKTAGERTRAIVARHVKEILLVGETDIERAVMLYLEVEKTVAEGAGAAALAGVLAHGDRFAGRKVGVCLSGGNLDSRLLAQIIMRGLMREHRVIQLRVEIDDRPGALATVAQLIADRGGNIIEVYHQRMFADVPVKSADLDLVVETRDAAHVDEIVSHIEAAGFRARRLATTSV